MSEKTEWLDLLVAKGIIAPSVQPDLSDDEQDIEIDPEAKFADLEEDEVDEEDERFFLQYKMNRLKEMKEKQRTSVFGQVVEINKAEYTKQVTEASQEHWVVVYLYKNSYPDCKLMSMHLDNLAPKFPATKFVKIVSDQCIENYPDRNIPCLIVYRNGDVKKQFVSLKAFYGSTTTAQDVEWKLKLLGAVPSEMEQDPRVSGRTVSLTDSF